MDDTVREELQTKITPCATANVVSRVEAVAKVDIPPRPAIIAPPVKKKAIVTAGLSVSKTSPTLVEFQNKSASLPDWRLQLQNAVQQRRSGQPAVISNKTFPTDGATALKAEAPVIAPPPVPEILDSRVANAMKRIDQSRQKFAVAETYTPKKQIAARPPQRRPVPVESIPLSERAPIAARPPIQAAKPQRPKLVVPAPAFEKHDTNKLPPISKVIERVVPIEEVDSIETPELENAVSDKLQPETVAIKRLSIRGENTEIEDTEAYSDEIEDLAPFSMRFGAGLFDLIVGAFVALLALSPFALGGGDWFTMSGLLVAVGVWTLVQFVYMTASLGLVGKTLGMRLFSLELVDAIENEYPTLHQAAISSSLFLLSLGLGGAGFLTIPFNEERRAVHDLLSGTILVREF